MWIYKDKRSFPPAIRPDFGQTSEYRRGWEAAKSDLRAVPGKLLTGPEQPPHA